MKVEGKLIKSGGWWAAEVPFLLVFTQGRTKKEAQAMVKDAIELMVDQEGFAVDISGGNDKDAIYVTSNNDRVLMAYALKQQRAEHGLTVREVAANLGSNSPNSYGRYESAKVGLTLDKFSQLLRAIDPGLEPVLKIG